MTVQNLAAQHLPVADKASHVCPYGTQGSRMGRLAVSVDAQLQLAMRMFTW